MRESNDWERVNWDYKTIPSPTARIPIWAEFEVDQQITRRRWLPPRTCTKNEEDDPSREVSELAEQYFLMDRIQLRSSWTGGFFRHESSVVHVFMGYYYLGQHRERLTIDKDYIALQEWCVLWKEERRATEDRKDFYDIVIFRKIVYFS